MSLNDEKFPNGFLWGAATSAHQVEGGQRNDWSEWEQSPARLADLERNGLLTKFGKENFISGIACDHSRRYVDDFRLAKELGHNTTRFSLEWSRIEREEGMFDETAIRHYHDVLQTARANGLEPFVTLWHWTNPLWFRDQGGWSNPRAPEQFARYVERVVTMLRESVRFWITLNEPEIVVASHLVGRFPPQRRSLFSYLHVTQNLLRAHRRAYRAIKQFHPSAQIGIAHNMNDFEAVGNNPLNHLLKRLADWWVNDYFFDRCADTQDFLGCNYYFHNRIDKRFNKNENLIRSDIGWEVFPDGLERVLLRLKKYRRPIYITENGIADAEDRLRPQFLVDSLSAVHRAIAQGADVRGYLHWSLLDNFEWDSGFWPRFGLIAVDRKTLQRTPRRSAFLFRDIILENGIPRGMLNTNKNST